MTIKPYYQSDRVTLYHGDCREVMASLDAVDAVVTDPPYGLSFMGKHWDYDVPGVEVWAECLRALKPGGHLLAFAGTRTQHRMAVNIEDAGFDIRDMIAWVYGSGFPKSLDVSKAIDKAAGVDTRLDERWVPTPHPVTGAYKTASGNSQQVGQALPGLRCLYLPASPSARQWSGWGTALKPAMEPITVARKPLEGTVAANVLRYGTGAINVDGCRVGDEVLPAMTAGQAKIGTFERGVMVTPERTGRWPANLIHDGSDEVVELFPDCKPATSRTSRADRKFAPGTDFQTGTMPSEANAVYGDTGSAARFFYCAKASKADRDEGCEGLEEIHRVNGNKWTDQDYRVARGERPASAESGPRRNHHPTVKPTDLMRYLCRLVTPPGGTILDPFMGSGSTGKAAGLENFSFVGIEREQSYIEIAEKRIKAVYDLESGSESTKDDDVAD